MILKKFSDKISLPYYSIILSFVIVFFSVPLITEFQDSSFSEDMVSLLNDSNSFDSKAGDKLFFLPYIPDVRINCETVGGLFIVNSIFSLKNIYEYFKLAKYDFPLINKKVNITWIQLSDGKK